MTEFTNTPLERLYDTWQAAMMHRELGGEFDDDLEEVEARVAAERGGSPAN